MKKSQKIIITGVILCLLIILGVGFSNFYPMLKMHPTETGRVENTEVLSIQTSKNSAYIIEGDD